MAGLVGAVCRGGSASLGRCERSGAPGPPCSSLRGQHHTLLHAGHTLAAPLRARASQSPQKATSLMSLPRSTVLAMVSVAPLGPLPPSRREDGRLTTCWKDGRGRD